jgi:hypothetical protein
VVHCSTSGFFSLRSKDPSLSEFRTNQRKACPRFAWFTARLQDFSHFVQKILLYPNSGTVLKNIFSKRYKQQSSCLEEGVTLYSFRHSGSVKVFEKTGSLLKLQQVRGIAI